MLMTAQAIALIIGLAAITGFAFYFVGIAWHSFLETRQKSAMPKALNTFEPEPPEPDEYDQLVTLICLDESLIEEVMHQGQEVMRHA